MDTFRIDEIARKLLERVPPALRSMQADLETNFRAVLRERLSKLDLVSRDEFDAQTRVLERTRAQLEALEGRLTALEGGGTTSLTCLYATASGVSPVCGCLPVSSSNSITPAAYTSVRASAAPPATCSGAR